MTIAATKTAEHEPSHWEVVLRAWEELDLPEGRRAEIIEGDITITLLSIELPSAFNLMIDTGAFPV